MLSEGRPRQGDLGTMGNRALSACDVSPALDYHRWSSEAGLMSSSQTASSVSQSGMLGAVEEESTAGAATGKQGLAPMRFERWTELVFVQGGT